jgi:phage N-6-adenine-methyltransferase
MSRTILTDERSTPIELFKELDDEFHFEVDVCACQDNFKVANYYHPSVNGLKQKWAPQRCFMNPPYSDIPRWLRKAYGESLDGALVVCILPVDSSTKWFHEFIWDKSTNQFRCEVRFPDKRYSFGEYSNVAKFATMIAIFGNKYVFSKRDTNIP